jgi:hypothetical protein
VDGERAGMRLVGVRVLPVAMKTEKKKGREGRVEPEAKALNSPLLPWLEGAIPYPPRASIAINVHSSVFRLTEPLTRQQT